MTKRLLTSIIVACMLVLALAACGTLTGAAVGAGGGAAIGYGIGYGTGKGALIGTGAGAAAGGTVTVREAHGTTHEFQASADTLRDVRVGGRMNAKLREASQCS